MVNSSLNTMLAMVISRASFRGWGALAPSWKLAAPPLENSHDSWHNIESSPLIDRKSSLNLCYQLHASRGRWHIPSRTYPLVLNTSHLCVSIVYFLPMDRCNYVHVQLYYTLHTLYKYNYVVNMLLGVPQKHAFTNMFTEMLKYYNGPCPPSP